MHFGVAPSRNHYSLEKRARRFGYDKLDFAHHPADSALHPGTGKPVFGFVDPIWDGDATGHLETNLSVQRLSESLINAGAVEAQVSTDAGKRPP